MNKISYRRHRFPAEIIQRAVRLTTDKLDEWLAGAKGSLERGVGGGMTVDRRGAVRITDGP